MKIFSVILLIGGLLYAIYGAYGFFIHTPKSYQEKREFSDNLLEIGKDREIDETGKRLRNILDNAPERTRTVLKVTSGFDMALGIILSIVGFVILRKQSKAQPILQNQSQDSEQRFQEPQEM